ncbi:MAG TPA: tetratricopeptide repeat protein, partial [candidate division Zixibacteria bacterium]|nr:tetratricopeptide repeat protein [candidate division Zixibacteria bacterium]
MSNYKMNRLKTLFHTIAIVLVLAGTIATSGCVYFNTFYNARKAFNEAESARKESLSKGRESIQKAKYDQAIEKALKVTEQYPNSGYYDDALYVLGVSYYYTNQQLKSERRLRELMANFPKSKYVDEATIYLAKSKLKQEDEGEAIVLFEQIFNGDFDKEYKTESALGLGNYFFDQREFDKSRPYFIAVRDSLGNDIQKRWAQSMIADSYFEQYNFKDALGNYQQLLGMGPDKNETYLATYRSAICSFRLQSIETGME